MGEASMMVPEPSSSESATAMSALVRAMQASGTVGLIRSKLIARRDLGVTLGVLLPCTEFGVSGHEIQCKISPKKLMIIGEV